MAEFPSNMKTRKALECEWSEDVLIPRERQNRTDMQSTNRLESVPGIVQI